jgi:hypothetical protein
LFAVTSRIFFFQKKKTGKVGKRYVGKTQFFNLVPGKVFKNAPLGSEKVTVAIFHN